MARWLPLESNPEVMTKFIRSLGVEEPWRFQDVYGFDRNMLAMVNRPVIAVLLLFPLSDKAKQKTIGEVKKEDGLYFMKQTIGNACGTIGIIHATANNVEKIILDETKHFVKFFEATKDMSPLEKCMHLEADTVMGGAHEETAQEGQTETPSSEVRVLHHFVAFVHHKGGLYELDGRNEAPVYHGTTTEDSLLEDAAVVIQKFMARDSEETGFSALAFCKGD